MKKLSCLFCFCLMAPVAADSNQVQIKEGGGYRIITSNGIPDHSTGQFPNRNNPNTIREQRHQYRVPINPIPAVNVIPMRLSPFGVALNGVPFDPGAAEFWRRDRRLGWQYEALSGKINLGLDQHHAHVQPNGAYHYHGLSKTLFKQLAKKQNSQMVHMGYAADGYPIYAGKACKNKTCRVSYRLRKGLRPRPPKGPGGPYDGTFVNDYEYVANSGDLDQCNGTSGKTKQYPQGTYYYVLTEQYPFIPRCFKAAPDPSFSHRRRAGANKYNFNWKEYSVAAVNTNNRNILKNLSQPYEAEFSTQTGAIPDAQGQYPVALHEDKNHQAFLMYHQEIPIGFAILGKIENVYDVEEFYIIPSHRRKGLGRALGHYLFNVYPGEWQVRQLLTAEYATKFWEEIIKEATDGSFVTSIVKDKDWGEVVKQRFSY